MIYLFACLFKTLFWLILRPRVYGNKAALKTKGKVIFICNHIALADPFMLALICPRIIHFMAKKELFESRIGRFFFKNLYVFPVDRGAPDIKSIKNALKLLEEGKAFGIFPEGRRMVADRMDEFEQGIAMIAMRSNAPVVPICMRNDCYRRFRFRFIVGDPVFASELPAKGGRRESEQIFVERLTNIMHALSCELEDK